MTVQTQGAARASRHRPMSREEKKVILASSLGTVFEWYDFFLYGSLATIIGAQFFSAYPPAARNIFALLAFAAGFLVRPLGALVFGRAGDIVGRKYTFLATISIMGLSTFVVGLLPNAERIGILAPAILISLRLLQGLALGGEYGGAATYVAEHAPRERRGYYTSWIQATATLGLLMSLLVILTTRSITGEAAFAVWGWRIPFLLSIALLGVSLWIRFQLNESPTFQRMKAEGTQSTTPLTESFGQWRNLKYVLIALFGLSAGQSVVWYTGQFYALFFLQSIVKVDGYTSSLLVAWSLLLGSGFFVFFGWLSDRIGRKPIILSGCLIASLVCFPVFRQLTTVANPALEQAINNVKVTVYADPAQCGNLFNPVGIRVFTSPCDQVRDFLAKSSVRYSVVPAPAGATASVHVNETVIPVDQGFRLMLGETLRNAGYPLASPNSAAPRAAALANAGVVKMEHPLDILRPQVASVIGLLFILALLATMVYGPMAAALVELFPTRIRYTSMSLPYHIGNGWFGGLLPATAFAMVAQTGDIYFGLWYPVVIAFGSAIIGMLFLPETKDRNLDAFDH